MRGGQISIHHCLAVDNRTATFRRLFAEGSHLGSSQENFGFAHGRDEAVELMPNIRSTYGRTIHTTNGQIISLVDSGSAWCPSHAEIDMAGQTFVCALRYYDEYRREARGWRLADRVRKWKYVLSADRMIDAPAAHLPVRRPGRAPGATEF
jgi:SnoaL-like protein